MDTIKETKELYEEYKNHFKDEKVVVEAIQLHQNTGLPFIENIFRIHSRNYYKSINEARKLWKEGKLQNVHEWDIELFKTNAGQMALYEGEEVPLDVPMINEAEYQGKKVELNKPKRGGSKKFYVYVKDGDKVKKVSFGAAGGGGSLAVKLKDPEAKKAFKERHNCEQKNDKTKPGYWSCRLPRYAKSLGLSGSGQWW
jgi:hypothetical protein